ncbi:MAG: DUF3800 domain-containing protein [bacterium]|nr:DUF3800 domain-containing protein [bacterium]
MEKQKNKQKIYAYVDETGQDAGSEFFIVVTVLSDTDQQLLRDALLGIELLAGTGRLKWHKSRHERRMKYLEMVLQRKIGQGEVFFGKYKKPLPYFFPMLETIKQAIIKKAAGDYSAIVTVDGIDKKKAAELTNALRVGGLKLKTVRGKRDESEPLIRLADMWAGCIRDAHTGGQAKIFYEQAMRTGYLIKIDQNKNPLRG